MAYFDYQKSGHSARIDTRSLSLQ